MSCLNTHTHWFQILKKENICCILSTYFLFSLKFCLCRSALYPFFFVVVVLFAFIYAPIQWVCLLSLSFVAGQIFRFGDLYGSLLYPLYYLCVSIFAYLAVFVYRNFLHMLVLCMCISLLGPSFFSHFVCLR
jgi:hypothetical protein